MVKYYCGLCETSHHELKTKVYCPECGRNYCLDSINQSISVGKDECPYCDTPYEWFADIPIEIKKKIRKDLEAFSDSLRLKNSKTQIVTFTPEVNQRKIISEMEKEAEIRAFRGYKLKYRDIQAIVELEQLLEKELPIHTTEKEMYKKWLKYLSWPFGLLIKNYCINSLNLYDHKSFLNMEKEDDLDILEYVELLAPIQLEVFPEVITRLTDLTDLDLHSTKLKNIPETIGNLSNLRSLDISMNEINTLPKSIGKLENLEKLDISLNSITRFPESIKNLINLQELYIGGNKCVPLHIFNLTKITRLDLSYQDLHIVPETIGNLHNLEYLDVSRNNLKTLPLSFKNLTELKELVLNDNKFDQIPEHLMHLTNLRSIDFGNNQLRSLPENIGNLKQIERISLYGNQLTFLPKFLLDLQSLKELFVSQPGWFRYQGENDSQQIALSQDEVLIDIEHKMKKKYIEDHYLLSKNGEYGKLWVLISNKYLRLVKLTKEERKWGENILKNRWMYQELNSSQFSDAIEAILTILKFNPRLTIERLSLLLNRSAKEIDPFLKWLAFNQMISYDGHNVQLV